MDKKAIEASANFLVIIIICIIMFAMAVAFLYKAFKPNDILCKIDQSDETRIGNLLKDDTFSVLIPYRGCNGQQSFIIGITNKFQDEKKFFISKEPDKFINRNGEETPYSGWNTWVIESNNPATSIKPNTNYYGLILIKPPANAQKGTYVFNVTVCYDSECNNNNKYFFHKMQVEIT